MLCYTRAQHIRKSIFVASAEILPKRVTNVCNANFPSIHEASLSLGLVYSSAFVALTVAVKRDWRCSRERNRTVNFHAPTKFHEAVHFSMYTERYTSGVVIWCSWQVLEDGTVKERPAILQTQPVRGQTLWMFRSGEYSITTGQWPEHKPKIVLPLHRASSSLAWLLSVSILYSSPSRTAARARARARSFSRGRNTWLSPVANVRVNELLSTSRILSIQANDSFPRSGTILRLAWCFSLRWIRSKPLVKRTRMTRNRVPSSCPFLSICTVDYAINRRFYCFRSRGTRISQFNL